MHDEEMVLDRGYQQTVRYLHDSEGVDEDVVGAQRLVVQLVYVQGVEGMAAAVQDAPHLILLEVPLGRTESPLQNLILYGLEGVLHDNLDFELAGAHAVLVDPGVLDQFEEVRVLDPLAPVNHLQVLGHLLLEIEGEDPEHEFLPLLLPPEQVLAGREGANNGVVLDGLLFWFGLLLAHS